MVNARSSHLAKSLNPRTPQIVVCVNVRTLTLCPNPCSMPEPSEKDFVGVPDWPKLLLFISVSGTDFHQQEGMG